jgi:uncharacterized protein
MMVALTERFEMRVDEETLERVDRWRAEQPDLPSRAEAMRRLVEEGLARGGRETVRFSDGEKLLLLMMGELFEHLGVEGDTDAEFVSKVIFGGHYWALPWQKPGVFHGHEDKPGALRYVMNVMDMWDRLERGFERLPKADRARVLKEANRKSVKFYGFDGNTEAEELGIAQFLVDEMGRWSRFEGRELNAHMPTRAIYARMLQAFEAMRDIEADDLAGAQIILLLKAMPHPG